MTTPATDLALPSAQDSAADVRLLDERGCLTDEVLCFISELKPEQRDVVERHLIGCPICSFHKAELSRAASRVRRARPRLSLSSDARLLGRQAVLRGQVRQQVLAAQVPRTQAHRGQRLMWVGLGVVAALLAGAITLLVLVLR